MNLEELVSENLTQVMPNDSLTCEFDAPDAHAASTASTNASECDL